MSNAIAIRILNQEVGSIHFTDSGADLTGHGIRRTADSYVIRLPARILLRRQPDAAKWQPLVSNLRATIYCDDQETLELGTAYDHAHYKPGYPQLDRAIEMDWHVRPETLQILEKRRNGGPAKLRLTISGNVTPYFAAPGDGAPVMLAGEPDKIYDYQQVAYPQEAWIQLLSNAGAVGNILVEIPITTGYPPEWRDIYFALQEAKRNLARGGIDGWKSSVGSVRLALEKWQELEKEDPGPGWVAPKPQDRANRTKKQRIDAIRWHLLQLSHLSPHSAAEEWSRDDGILAVATLAALLSARDP